MKNNSITAVSVIIAVYNTENHLRQCLDSIINQTLTNIEIICVNDCSTDNSLNILEEYEKKDPRIKVISFNKNCGPGKARNEAMKIANGEYIAFVDSDDWIAENMLQEQYQTALEHNPDFISSNWINFIDNEKNTDPKILEQLHLQNQYINCFNSNKGLFDFDLNTSPDLRIATCGNLYKKSIIDKHEISFPENLIEEDVGFYFTYMVWVKKIYKINTESYHRRIHQNSILFKLSFYQEGNYDKIEILKFIYNYLKKHGIYKKYNQKYLKFVNAMLYKYKRIFCCIPFLKLLLKNPIDMFKIMIKQSITTPLQIFQTIHNHKEEKIVFWGASLFLVSFLSKYKLKFDNIIGIADKNPAKWNTELFGYTIHSPELLLKDADIVIFTIANNSSEIYPMVKKYIEEKYKHVKLEKNIFE